MASCPKRRDLRESGYPRSGSSSPIRPAKAGNISAVARAMGTAPMQIRRWMRRYALDVQGFRR